MIINIDELLKKQNKTRYWLAKKIDLTYQNLCNLAENKTVQTRFDTLEKICWALNCTPSDLLILSPPPNIEEIINENDKT